MSLIPNLVALIAKLAKTYTLHMRTSHLLLDRLVTLRTLPCIVLDPGGVSDFRIQKGLPFLHLLATSGRVGLLETLETVHLPAGARYNRELHHGGFGAEVRTFLVGTVADVPVLDGVAHQNLSSVELPQFGRDGVGETSQHRSTRA
jgi:hypothetical protein